MLNIKRALAGTLLLSFVLSGSAQPSYAEKVLQGEVCSERVHELTSEINWNRNLHKAEDEARQQGKLVFWLHIVGKIDGAT